MTTALALLAAVPRFTPARLVTQTPVLQAPALLIAVVGLVYLVGVRRLRSRGDRWPVSRTVAFLAGGLGTLALALVSGLAAYDDVLISAHMVQHMLLIMVAPIFLALGAPITLALRTLPPPARRVLLRILHSRVARVLAFPLVGFALFTLSSYALYFTGLYEATLRSQPLHHLVHLHFLVVGCLFFWPLVGFDPVPGRVPYPFRALMMFAALPLHAILGLTIMQTTHVLAGGFYSQEAPGIDHLHDQLVAGGILWAAGDLVGLLMLGALVGQWMRASEREAAREDRRLDRLEAKRTAGPRLDGQPSAPSEP